MVGFQNAAALLILMSQLDTMLGLGPHAAAGAALGRLASVQPLTLAIGALTALSSNPTSHSATCSAISWSGRPHMASIWASG